jgi:hypothetical protein
MVAIAHYAVDAAYPLSLQLPRSKRMPPLCHGANAATLSLSVAALPLSATPSHPTHTLHAAAQSW